MVGLGTCWFPDGSTGDAKIAIKSDYSVIQFFSLQFKLKNSNNKHDRLKGERDYAFLLICSKIEGQGHV